MSTFPNSPKVQRGALIGVDPANPLASAVVFQYNPDRVTRTLRARTTPTNGEATGPMRLTGPPEETIALDVDLDAADQMEKGRGENGLYPALSAIEMLLYPKMSLVLANEGLLNAGIIEVLPPEAPMAMLVWGVKRVVPVRLTGFTITEEAFDPNLNPIRASVSLSMTVLTYQDLGIASPGGALFLAHQAAKELLATTNIASG